MIIVIEGPDNAGKSTFAQALLSEGLDRELTSSVVHSAQPSGDAYREYRAKLSQPPEVRLLKIYDRLHWGQMVYPRLYRPEEVDSYGVPEFLANELELAAAGGLVVHLTHDPAVLQQRGAENGEEYLQSEDVSLCTSMFREVFDLSVAPAITLVDPTPDDAVDVLNFATALSASAKRSAVGRGYIGHPDPEVVFVTPVDASLHYEAVTPDSAIGRTVLDALFAEYHRSPRRFGLTTPFGLSEGRFSDDTRVVVLTADDAPRVEKPETYADRIGLEALWSGS